MLLDDQSKRAMHRYHNDPKFHAACRSVEAAGFTEDDLRQMAIVMSMREAAPTGRYWMDEKLSRQSPENMEKAIERFKKATLEAAGRAAMAKVESDAPRTWGGKPIMKCDDMATDADLEAHAKSLEAIFPGANASPCTCGGTTGAHLFPLSALEGTMSSQWNDLTDAEKIESLRLGIVAIGEAVREFAAANARLSDQLSKWADEFQVAFGGKPKQNAEDRLRAFQDLMRKSEPAACQHEWIDITVYANGPREYLCGKCRAQEQRPREPSADTPVDDSPPVDPAVRAWVEQMCQRIVADTPTLEQVAPPTRPPIPGRE